MVAGARLFNTAHNWYGESHAIALSGVSSICCLHFSLSFLHVDCDVLYSSQMLEIIAFSVFTQTMALCVRIQYRKWATSKWTNDGNGRLFVFLHFRTFTVRLKNFAATLMLIEMEIVRKRLQRLLVCRTQETTAKTVTKTGMTIHDVLSNRLRMAGRIC